MTAERSLSTQRLRWLVVAACLVAGSIAWWWPRLSGRGDSLGVLIVGNGQFAQSRDAIERQMRGLGLTVEWHDLPKSWCEAADSLPTLIAASKPQRVIASFVENGSCADGVAAVMTAVGSTTLVVQVQPGVQSEALAQQLLSIDSKAVTTVDPTPMLPGLGLDAPCMWWDDCSPAGAVMIRDTNGNLAPAGAQRVARALAAVLP